jgi:hypothetical protein
MSNITSGANKRTSTRVNTTDVPIVKKSTQSPIIGAITTAVSGVNNFVSNINNAASSILPQKFVATQLQNLISKKSGIKWIASNPTAATAQGYPRILPNNFDASVRNRSKSSNLNNTGSKLPSSTDSQPVSKILATPDKTYKWNLPPHKWSLPVDPSSISDTVKAPNKDLHTKRRGVIFVARKYNGNTTSTNAKTGKKENTGIGNYNNNYGFQFLWNPETFNQSTSVNWGITPNQNDKTALLTGLVSANSTVDFTLRLDRTNDFACAKANNLTESLNSSLVIGAFNESRALQQSSLDDFASYYKEGKAPNSDADFSINIDEKLKDLLTRGTEADLEFLYRTINGDGYTTSWGTSSSNISFLLPTIIRLDLGPQKLVGMVQSVNVVHLAFTREMIPIRTDVSLSIDLRTAVGLTTNNFGNSVDEVNTVIGNK